MGAGMTDILKLCCRCGGIPKIGMYKRKYETAECSGESVAYYVECQKCKADTIGHYSKFEAINEWNDMND